MIKKNELGPEYLAGFKWALDHHYSTIFEMDCDFSHDPNNILKLHHTLS